MTTATQAAPMTTDEYRLAEAEKWLAECESKLASAVRSPLLGRGDARLIDGLQSSRDYAAVLVRRARVGVDAAAARRAKDASPVEYARADLAKLEAEADRLGSLPVEGIDAAQQLLSARSKRDRAAAAVEILEQRIGQAERDRVEFAELQEMSAGDIESSTGQLLAALTPLADALRERRLLDVKPAVDDYNSAIDDVTAKFVEVGLVHRGPGERTTGLARAGHSPFHCSTLWIDGRPWIPVNAVNAIQWCTHQTLIDSGLVSRGGLEPGFASVHHGVVMAAIYSDAGTTSARRRDRPSGPQAA